MRTQTGPLATQSSVESIHIELGIPPRPETNTGATQYTRLSRPNSPLPHFGSRAIETVSSCPMGSRQGTSLHTRTSSTVQRRLRWEKSEICDRKFVLSRTHLLVTERWLPASSVTRDVISPTATIQQTHP